MEIKWLRLALNDLDDIAEYISKDNPSAARKLVETIWRKVRMLKDHPNIGRPGRVANTRELVIENTKYIVPYRVINNQVQVLRVLHGARKWPEEF